MSVLEVNLSPVVPNQVQSLETCSKHKVLNLCQIQMQFLVSFSDRSSKKKKKKFGSKWWPIGIRMIGSACGSQNTGSESIELTFWCLHKRKKCKEERNSVLVAPEWSRWERIVQLPGRHRLQIWASVSSSHHLSATWRIKVRARKQNLWLLLIAAEREVASPCQFSVSSWTSAEVAWK